jgi:hypothetical protein
MLGITSLGDAQRYGLDTAELQTSSTSASEERFTDASGRTFVAPNEDSLRAAAATLQPDEATRTWKFGSTTAKDAPKAADAYPASMLVYAQVPTKGLEAEEAKEFATFLRFAATDGQTPGYGNGQLPPGFLPLTAANGLGALADYTLRAAAAVEAQDGSIPALVPVDHGAKPTASDPPAGFSGSAPTDQFSDDFSVSDPFGTLFGDLTAGATPDAEPEPKDEGAEKEPAESPKVATVAYLSDVVGRLLRIAVVVAVVAGGAALVISAASRRRSRRAAVGGGAS